VAGNLARFLSGRKAESCRAETLRRLTRTEYQNAIRDLLASTSTPPHSCPADESGHGFDRHRRRSVGDAGEPLHLSRPEITGLAVGITPSLQNDIIRVPASEFRPAAIRREPFWITTIAKHRRSYGVRMAREGGRCVI
jgi:hypothetical protein